MSDLYPSAVTTTVIPGTNLACPCARGRSSCPFHPIEENAMFKLAALAASMSDCAIDGHTGDGPTCDRCQSPR
jgi:hypothetical protein